MNANYEKLVAEVEASKVDADKFFGEKANAQAGKRLRAYLKVIGDLTKELRKEVSAVKAERKATV